MSDLKVVGGLKNCLMKYKIYNKEIIVQIVTILINTINLIKEF